MDAGASGVAITDDPVRSRPGRVVVPALSVSELCVHFDSRKVLGPVSMDIARNQVTALIGPSGCGKTTLLRAFNRMHDTTPGCRVTGDVLLDGQSLYGARADGPSVRRKIGMVFQKPNPFPKSVFENVAYGLRLLSSRGMKTVSEKVEQALQRAALWNEVKDRLHHSALSLSGGQQQRLCVARALVVEPQILLMDEPASALDPLSTNHIEELIGQLVNTCTIAIVTHNLQQAARIADYAAFMYLGQLVEFGERDQIFKAPRNQKTAEYVRGAFG
jgi:phosphate transport system ATP-binding protein